MKKAFLPLLAALALSASAQVPTTFNYQGVSAYQSAEITVSFEVLDAEGYTVYQEDQQVTTNANGVYTAVIGEGTPTRGTWEAVNWADGGYSIATYINGVNVSVAPLQAVPYANVASSLAGAAWDEVDYLATTVDDLVMTNRNTQTDLAELRLDVNTALEFANTAGTIATTGYEELQDLKESVEALQNGVDVLEEDVRPLVLANRENATDIAELKDAVEANTANIQALALFQQNFDEEYLSPIQEKFDAIDAELENAYMMGQVTRANEAAIEALEDAMLNVTSDVQGLSEKMRGLATVEALAELEAAQDAYDRDLQETLAESFGSVADELEGLHAQVDGAYEILNELLSEDGQLNTILGELNDAVEANAANIQALALFQQNFDEEYLTPIQEKFDAIDAELENAYMMGQVTRANEAAIEELEGAMANVTSDVQGISEKMRGLATVEALAELEAAQDEYDRQLQETLAESFGSVSDELQKHSDRIDALLILIQDNARAIGMLQTLLDK